MKIIPCLLMLLQSENSQNINDNTNSWFLEFLQNKIPGLEYVNDNYRIEEKMYDSSLEISPIIETLKTDTYLFKFPFI